MTPSSLPVIRLKPKANARAIRHGAPWVFDNELVTDRRTKAIAPGSIAVLEDAGREPLALVAVNPKSRIMGRVLDLDTSAEIGEAWLRERLSETVIDLAPRDAGELTAFGDAAPPEVLVSALAPALQRNTDVGAAFLVEAEIAGDGKARRFVLVLDVGDAEEEIFAEVARDVGIAARSALGDDELMDIIAFNPAEGTGRALIERSIVPIFARAQDALH